VARSGGLPARHSHAACGFPHCPPHLSHPGVRVDGLSYKGAPRLRVASEEKSVVILCDGGCTQPRGQPARSCCHHLSNDQPDYSQRSACGWLVLARIARSPDRDVMPVFKEIRCRSDWITQFSRARSP
jgi:hypothetical protein